MKRVLIYPICFVSTCAIASTTFYYETGGQCPTGTGLFLNPNATSCTQAISKITPPSSQNGRSFAGYWANGQQVIDKSGNILVTSQTVANLFDDSDSSQDRPAQAAYTGTDYITVQTAPAWMGQYNGWYTCSVYGFHMCVQGANYYAPPAVNCWSVGTYPCSSNGCNYDYKFNSYRLANGDYLAASCVRGGGCESASGCWCNNYPEQSATGSTYKSNGCSSTYLGPLTENGTLSSGNVFPFACKRFNVNGTWTDSVNVDNGKIVLDNSEPGKCEYRLDCNDNYTPSNSGTKVKTCQGTDCKGFFTGGNANSLITATCVAAPLSCPQLNAPSGVTVSEPTNNGTQCIYLVGCSNTNYTLNGGGSTLTCSPDNCQNQLNNYSCMAPTCPPAPAVPGGHGSVSTPTPDSNGNCHYTLKCNKGYAMPDDNNPTPSFDCSFNSCNGLTGWVSGLQCKAKISCPYPSKNEIHGTVNTAQINNYTACKYTIDCNSPAYVCNTDMFSGNLCVEDGVTCEEDCNDTLFQIMDYGCKFQCPSVAYVKSKIWGLDSIDLNTTISGKDCVYQHADCSQCYELTSATSAYCNDTNDEQCNNNTWYTGISCEYVGGDGCSSM